MALLGVLLFAVFSLQSPVASTQPASEPAAGQRFGAALAMVPDQNGDGISEILVSAPEAGAVAMLSGRDCALLRLIQPEQLKPGFGDYLYAPLSSPSGGAAVLASSFGLKEAAHLIGLDGELLWSLQGYSVVLNMTDDEDGDGRPDLIIASRNGKLAVVSSATGDRLERRPGIRSSFFVEGSGGILGEVYPLPGDGYVEIRPFASESGMLRLAIPVEGNDCREEQRVQCIYGKVATGVSGYVVGLPWIDLVKDSEDSYRSGAVFVFSERGDLLGELYPPDVGDRDHEFGYRLSGLGNLLGDEAIEFAVGAPDVPSSSVSLYSGLDGPLWVQEFGPGAEMGVDIVGADDINEDGVPEIVVSGGDHEVHGTYYRNGSVVILCGRTGRVLSELAESSVFR